MSPPLETHGVEFTRVTSSGLGAPLSFRSSAVGSSWQRLGGAATRKEGMGERIRSPVARLWGLDSWQPPHTKSRGSRGSHDTVDWKVRRVYVSRPEGQLRSSPLQHKLPGHLPSRTLPLCWGGKGATSPGLGASGSLHPETCYSPSPESAALLPCNIPEAGTTHVRLSLWGTHRPLDHLTESQKQSRTSLAASAAP